VVAFVVGWREAPRARRLRRRLVAFGDSLGALGADVVSWAQRPRATRPERLALPAPAQTPAEPRDLNRGVVRLQPQPAPTVDDYDAVREQAVLKRKRAAVASDEVSMLRAKNGAAPDRETGVLKAKLAASPPPAQKGKR